MSVPRSTPSLTRCGTLVARSRRIRQSSQRGAVLVEALIVTSLLALTFMGLVFFRDFYVQKLVAARLARGSVLVHSMTGCTDNSNEPAQWIGQADLLKLTAARPGYDQRPASDPNTMDNTSAVGEAGDVMGRVPGLSGDGKGIMNPIVNSHLSGRSRTTTKSGALSPERTVFDQELHARSFVSCADPVRDGNFGDVIKYIEGIFK